MNSSFEDNLNYNCDGSEHDLIIVSLKSLGNAGVKTDRSPMILSRCMLREDLPVEMRVEAIKAYRRFSCAVEVCAFI